MKERVESFKFERLESNNRYTISKIVMEKKRKKKKYREKKTLVWLATKKRGHQFAKAKVNERENTNHKNRFKEQKNLLSKCM